ncbi:MAG: L-histidine N(alpha)-methyltransferase [Thermoplasmataceae archaeon]
MSDISQRVQFFDYKNVQENLKLELLRGLLETPKWISPKFFYDKTGSILFNSITEVPEYYLTDKEISILSDHIDEICEIIGKKAALIEYGGANLKKVIMILDHCKEINCYVPIDISALYMLASAEELTNRFDKLEITAVSADFTKSLKIPNIEKYDRRTILFLGSSIGNFEPFEIVQFLKNANRTISEGDCMIIGVDMKKDSEILNNAYNDSEGVTAKFNLNLIERINSEFNSNIDISKFRHYAAYSEKNGRIEMYLKVAENFQATISGKKIEFKEDELIHTENSYKFTVNTFSKFVKKSGFRVVKVWQDNANYYSVFVIMK